MCLLKEDMVFDNQKLGKELIRLKYVKEEEIKKALESIEKSDSSIVDYILSQQILTKDVLGQAIAKMLNVQYVDLTIRNISLEQEKQIPEDIIKKYHIALFDESKENVTVATDNPAQAGLEKILADIFKGKKVKIVFAFTADIGKEVAESKKPLETKFSKIIASNKRVAPEIINEIIEDALSSHASDIHLEPEEEEVIIRFRIDGVLHEAGRIPKESFENIVNRIKVQARLRVDEHFSAQDGSTRIHRKDGDVDLRISIVPTIDGENVVIRILAVYVQGLSLTNLGVSSEDQKLVAEAAKRPFGMFLSVGPTGSGKTTTLYSILKTFSTSEVNITSIEDPVEYKIAGANQIQVNEQTNLTFAKGLRSIVRQDPDIIFVGEIRDRETAEIAVNAALTGHLLFSSFHANDAATAIPRLLNMGIEAFLLASTLQLVTAQRLVRKICEKCRYSTTTEITEIEKALPSAKKYFGSNSVPLYRGKGCQACGNKGYQGRTGLFEFINNSAELQDLIMKNPSSKEIRALTSKLGYHSLFEDGVLKVKEGITTIEELLRVARPEEY